MATLGVVVLLACALLGLVLIPLGLPGLWVIVGGILAYGWLTDFRTVGLWTIGLALGLAFLGEVIEWWVGFRYAKRYGGSRRAGWGALLGGIVGAIVGVPVPLIGSVIGAFLGSFVGAVALEYLGSRHAPTAVRAGWGAVLGRAAAAALKTGVGLVIIVLGVVAMVRA